MVPALLSRDRIKEGWVHTMLRGGAELPEEENLLATNAFFDALDLLVERNVSCVAEAAFQHKLWSARMEPFYEKANVRLLVCRVDPEKALDRFLERGVSDPGRLRFHGDKGVRMLQEGVRPAPGVWEEPRLPVPTIHVDTADGYAPSLESLRAELLPNG